MPPQPWFQAAQAIMAETMTCTLATVDAQGDPHAANLNFVPLENLSLAFISNPDSAHAQHVIHHRRVAVALYPPFESTDQIRGLQLRCEAHPVAHEAFESHWRKLIERFPEAAAQTDRAKQQRFYRLEPMWVRLIDNRRGFGWRMESDWPTGPQA